MAEAKRRELTVDEAIASVGDFGLQQKLQTVVCAGTFACCAFQTLLALFGALGATDPVAQRLIECTKTGGDVCEAALASPYPDLCGLTSDAWGWIPSRGFSLVTEFSLTCDRAWLAHAAGGCFFLGAFLGTALWHWLSDRLPPRRALSAAAVVTGVAGCLAATAPFLWIFMLFRVVAGVGVAGMAAAAFALTTDLTGPAWRPFAGLFLHLGFSAGAAAATMAAWVVPSWRWLTLLAALAPLALTLTAPSFLVESPQWLLLHSRKGEATAALAAVAFANRTQPPQYPLADPSALLANPHRSAIDILRAPRVRRLAALLGAVWTLTSAAYYGGIMLTDALGSGVPTGDGGALSLAFAGFSYEVLGAAAAGLVAERLGRKVAAAGGLAGAGACLLGASLAAGDARRALAVAARFGLAAAMAILTMISWETFPTAVQHPGMALTFYAARGGAVAAPALALAAGLLRSGCLVPLAVSGAACLGAAFLTTLVPETLGSPLYETLLEAAGAGARRHRSWTYSLRSVFKPLPGTPAGAIALPMDPAGRSV